MAFFDPNNSGPFDPSTFDYKAEQGKLQLQQAMAQQLMSTQQPQAQMVSGHYVAPSGLAQLASALSKVYGAYQMGNLQDQQSKLDTQGIQALQYQLNNAPQPTTSMVPTDKTVPMGPPAPADIYNPSNVQRDSVPTPDVSVRPMGAQGAPVPPAGPLAGAVAAQAPVNPATVPSADTGGYGTAMDTQKVSTAPSIGDQMAYIAKVARTGPMGQTIATGLMQRQFPNYDVHFNDNDGKVVFVDKNNPTNYKVVGYTGDGPTKTELEKGKLVADTNKSNAEAAKASTETGTGLAKAQGESLGSMQKEQGNIASYDKAIGNLQRMSQLAQVVGSKYPLAGSLQELWTKYGTSDPDVNELKQLFATGTMETAKEALAGSGRLSQSEFKVFAENTPGMTTNPTAVANLAGRTIQTLQAQKAISNAVLGEHKRIYGALGGNAGVFDNSAPAIGTPTVPGYKQRITSPYSQQ